MAEKRKPKAPKGCYWRGETLWGRFEVKGVEYRRSLRTSDARIAIVRLDAEREKVKAEQHFGEKRPTWKDAIVSWTTSIKAHAKPRTVGRYLTSLKQLAPLIGDLHLDEINKACINDIVRKRRMAGVTNATIKRDLTAMSSVFNHAEEEDLVDGNPALNKIRKIKERRDPIVLPETASVEYVIDRAPVRFGRIIRAAWETGCRLDELRTLTWRNVDLRRAQITLSKTKASKVRVIDMYDSATLFKGAPRAKTTDFVFWHGPDIPQSKDGKADRAGPYLNVSSNFRRLVASAQKSAQREAKAKGVECTFRPFTFHHLRHLFAVESLKMGRMGIYDLQQHLGHSSVQVTEMYLDFLTAEEQAAARKGSAQKPEQ